MVIAFLSVNAILTSYALKVFYYRISAENNLNIEDKNYVQKKYAQIEKSNSFDGMINRYYDNEKMLKTYPNIMIEEKDKNTVYIESLVKGVKPYYYRLGEAF